jgi:LysR family cyn operon transcriptional activator
MVAEFVRFHPAIHVPVSTGTDCSVEKGVRTGELDLGLLCQSVKAPDLNALQLFKEDIVVVVSRKHRLARSAMVRLRDLPEVALALPTTDFTSRRVIDAAFAAADIEPQVMVETNDIDVLLGLAKHGIAAAIVTGRAAAHLHVQSTSTIRLNEKGLQLTAAVVWPRNGSISPAAARFIKLATGHLRKLAARHA